MSPSPIMDRYRDRPDAQAEIKANWEAWERLREMSLEPSIYQGKEESWRR